MSERKLSANPRDTVKLTISQWEVVVESLWSSQRLAEEFRNRKHADKLSDIRHEIEDQAGVLCLDL